MVKIHVRICGFYSQVNVCHRTFRKVNKVISDKFGMWLNFRVCLGNCNRACESAVWISDGWYTFFLSYSNITFILLFSVNVSHWKGETVWTDSNIKSFIIAYKLIQYNTICATTKATQHHFSLHEQTTELPNPLPTLSIKLTVQLTQSTQNKDCNSSDKRTETSPSVHTPGNTHVSFISTQTYMHIQ